MPADPRNIAPDCDKAKAAAQPGDWKASPAHIEEGEPVVRHKTGWIVASTCSDEYARLIAAAPDLLEALKAIVAAEDAALAEWPQLSVHPWTGDEPAMKRLAAARAAIQRAGSAE